MSTTQTQPTALTEDELASPFHPQTYAPPPPYSPQPSRRIIVAVPQVGLPPSTTPQRTVEKTKRIMSERQAVKKERKAQWNRAAKRQGKDEKRQTKRERKEEPMRKNGKGDCCRERRAQFEAKKLSNLEGLAWLVVLTAEQDEMIARRELADAKGPTKFTQTDVHHFEDVGGI